MDDLFDLSKPHFAVWLRIYEMDKDWPFSSGLQHPGSPLYRATFCGSYDLLEHPIAKHPEKVQVVDGHMLARLLAALSLKHFRVALLHQHGAAVDIRGNWEKTPLHTASMYGLSDIVQWPLNHKADVANDQVSDGSTPLHQAALNDQLEVVHVLLDHNWNTGIGSSSDTGTYDLGAPQSAWVGVWVVGWRISGAQDDLESLRKPQCNHAMLNDNRPCSADLMVVRLHGGRTHKERA
jgi:ankyrin repeat protein